MSKREYKKPLFYVFDLEKDEKVSGIEMVNYKTDIIKVKDLEEAIMQQSEINNIRSICDLKIAYYNKEYKELSKKYAKTREQLEDSNRHMISRLSDNAKDLYQKTVTDQNTIKEIISESLTGYKESGDVEKAANRAFDRYYEKLKAKNDGEYKGKFEVEKSKADFYKKQLKQKEKADPFLALTNQIIEEGEEKDKTEPDFNQD